ncbi:MAG: carbohydrate binding family 9 domain-containing protein [Chlorobi bacterium]|nr:carbohydrate binding family 9 domain-containing protein [Chlorobiota bacterium]
MSYRLFGRFSVFFFVVALTTPVIGGNSKSNPFAQKKTAEALKIFEPPKIDGVLDDACWENARVADDFIQYAPYNGKPATLPTEVRILYDDKALYIGAMMYDPYPDSIYTELGKRDADRNIKADNFNVDINPFHDGVNGLTFKVSASGVQTDIKRSNAGRHGRDLNWDAVWYSAVKINDKGWVAEIKIPYSAIRFPKQTEPVWGINFWREIRRYQEYSSWNYVNREVGSSFNYMGNLVGIKSIDPPLRLSITPYVSGYLENHSDNHSWGTSYNGGLDLRYGINEGFTLDMTLIPDFGQVQSDDVVLNLSPFEIKYNEKRQFFTEGTELFNKGGIFYSRRIGSRPTRYNKAGDNLPATETVIDNPSETQLINATKVSGRNKHGLGIGVFNAVTSKMHAVIEDTETGKRRNVETQPYANYSLFVLDQSLKNNSFVSLVNTNVLRFAPRDEDNYTANVTATDFSLKNRNNLYSVSGQAALSQKYYDSLPAELGHRVFLRLGKTGGIFRAEYQTEMMSDTYDPNDMGFLRRNNYISNQVQFSYNMYKPKGIILSSRNELQFEYSKIYAPRVYSGFTASFNSFTRFTNYWYAGVNIGGAPFGRDDYFEPRVQGRYFHTDPGYLLSGWIATNRNKAVSTRIRARYGKEISDYGKYAAGFSISPTVRLNNRFQLSHDFSYDSRHNDIGYVGRNADKDSVFFGMRLNKSISNTLSASYVFTKDIYLTFRLRHYWSKVDYNGTYYLLELDGQLSKTKDFAGTRDINYNAFNIDMSYIWRFAPGSEMSLVWKNSIYNSGNNVTLGFMNNLTETLRAPQVNSFSLKILYYLDYQSLKRNES